MLEHDGLVLARLVLPGSGVGDPELLKMAELFYSVRIVANPKARKDGHCTFDLELLNIFHFAKSTINGIEDS